MNGTLIMMIGISASGKSTIAKEHLRRNMADKIISSDEIRKELYGDENEQKNNGEVFREVHKRIKRLLKEDKVVVYDATNLSSRRRMNFLKELGNDTRKECVLVLKSFDECVRDDMSRARHVGEAVIRKQIKQFQCPNFYEGWDDIRVIHMSNIPLEWFMEQNKIPHDNPNHTEDIYTHMGIASNCFVGVSNGSFYDKRLAEAIAFHDIGKYFCKEFDENRVAHYYGHQNVGAYFFLLDSIRFNRKNGLKDSLYIANLIQWHMEFFTRDKRGIKRLSDMVGAEMFHDLEVLNECDKMAK